MDKSYRIKANISQDTVLNVKLEQDVKNLEILSLKLSQENYYTLHNSSYGVIIGRVLANDAFGVPNVKVSLFIPLSSEDADDSEITNIYPYTSVQSFDKEYRRYNLLPDENENDACYRVIGTFPNKRLVLDNDTVLEVYDKYWKYTTVTNNAGDYMLFGIPTGNQEVHIDVDLSDIGVLSQKPRDMLYKGYNIEQFDSANQFKEGTNLNNLSQVITQNQTVYVYPFWGDEELGEIAISRCDINVDYKFEPTCVFMGSLVSDNSNQQISHKCTPTKYCGFNRGLVAGEGTIEMIRKSIDGLTEEFQIKGNKLIDNDGVWCYQIPMNLDYVQTDEYGNIVPTDNPNKGIPTRARVRFRFSFAEGSIEGSSKHRAKYLVPNNPQLSEDSIEPQLPNAGATYESYYEFGSSTPESCYRNLYWNKVYSVKSFIPRIQTTNKKGTQLYTGIRTTNISGNLNPFPFNKGRFKIFFSYRIICLLVTFIVYIVTAINAFISVIDTLAAIKIFGWQPFKFMCVGCIAFEGGLTDDGNSNTVFYPGCSDAAKKNCTNCPDSLPKCEKTSNVSELTDTIQENLAQEYDTVNLDFYNDWINGCLYFPIWYWKKTKKKSYLFGLFKKKAQNVFCSCQPEKVNNKLVNGYLGALNKHFPSISDVKNKSWQQEYYNIDKKDKNGKNDKEDKWSEKYRNYKTIKYGLIKEKTNKDGLNVYYYSYGNVTDRSYIADPHSPKNFTRLFSTDIILLGSFNDCDLDGIPKLFRYLPPTTANIPFMSKVTESASDSEDDGDDESEEGGRNDKGNVVISGMDWLYNGNKQSPLYSAGLLMDISCVGVGTRLKTNVNLERMSELGVNLDMSYDIPYTNGNTQGYLYRQTTYPDGMITRYEINDNESRYMFASLNHLGLDTLVRNEKTTYDVYKVGAIYPVDFDGMLTTSEEYTKSAPEKTRDNADVNYVEYRLGKVPHAYLNENGDNTYNPLYNNSFYFYFGLNEGNTAIDKFKTQYDGTCYQNQKYPFAITYITTAGSWCSNTEDLGDFATIDVTLKDVALPFSYRLMNGNGITLFEGSDVADEHLYFGFEDEGLTKNGKTAFVNGEKIDISNNGVEFIENDTYYLVVTDNKRKTMTQVIDIKPQAMEVDIEKQDLDGKFYSYSTEEMKKICTEDGEQGQIKITLVHIDGREYKITSVEQLVTSDEESNFNLELTLVGDEETSHTSENVLLNIASTYSETDDEGESVKDYNFTDCQCDAKITNISGYEFDEETNTLIFNVWIPSTYKLNLIQYCNGELSDNVYNQNVIIENGKSFVGTIDEMPTDLVMKKGLYDVNLSNISIPTDEKVKNWFNLSQLDCRNIDTTTFETKVSNVYNIPNCKTKKNVEIYSNYIPSLPIESDGTINDESIQLIQENILNWVFSLEYATYSTTERTAEHEFKLKGGRAPYLLRTIKPRYDKASMSETLEEDSWLVDSYGTSTANMDFPDIIVNKEKNGAIFNPYIDGNIKEKGGNTYLSTYFAGFTLKGGYLKENESGEPIFDENMKGIHKVPTNTNVLKELKPQVIDKVISFASDYKSRVTKDNSYLATPFIDRRLDYNMYVISLQDIPNGLFTDASTKIDLLTKYTYIRGELRNGIDMAYDDEYNIISSAKTGNYEYYCDETNSLFDDSKKQYYYSNNKCTPMYYSTLINDIEIKNKVISEGNASSITERIDNISDTSKNMIFISPNDKSVFNDKFSFNGNFSNINYPTKRLIHCFIKKKNTLTFDNISCSYNMSVTHQGDSDNDYLQALTRDGEEVDFEISLKSAISMKAPSLEDAMNESNYNLVWLSSNDTEFKCVGSRIAYNVNGGSDNGTHITYTPRMNYFEGKNQNELLSMAGFNSKGNVKGQLFDAKNIPSGVEFTKKDSDNLLKNILSNGLEYNCSTLREGENYLDDSDTNVKNVLYAVPIKDYTREINLIDSTSAFDYYPENKCRNVADGTTFIAIGGYKLYANSSLDGLDKSIQTLVFPKVFDVRNIGYEISEDFSTIKLTFKYGIEENSIIQEVGVKYIALDEKNTSVGSITIEDGKVYSCKFSKTPFAFGNIWELYLKMHNGLIYCLTNA